MPTYVFPGLATSLKFEKQTKTAIKECYSAVQPRIIFLPLIYKNHVPTTQQSIVVTCISIQVPLRLPVRGLNFVTAGQINTKFICNNQKSTKLISKRNCKKINTTKPLQCDSAIFSKTNNATTTTMANNFLSLPGQEMHSIFQHWKPLTSKP